MTNSKLIRCPWPKDNLLYINYHDREWGTPTHDDRQLFELICLEGAQAGLSWLTILKRREGYRSAFNNFNIKKVADYNQDKIDELIKDIRIIRNRLKVSSAVTNAQAALAVQKQFGSLDNYFWRFVDYKPVQHKFTTMNEIPTYDDVAEKLSKDLKRYGFRFVGPSICYAFMQSIGMVNDHLISCYRYKAITPRVYKV